MGQSEGRKRPADGLQNHHADQMIAQSDERGQTVDGGKKNRGGKKNGRAAQENNAFLDRPFRVGFGGLGFGVGVCGGCGVNLSLSLLRSTDRPLLRYQVQSRSLRRKFREGEGSVSTQRAEERSTAP